MTNKRVGITRQGPTVKEILLVKNEFNDITQIPNEQNTRGGTGTVQE
jgi:hypothetical protein